MSDVSKTDFDRLAQRVAELERLLTPSMGLLTINGRLSVRDRISSPSDDGWIADPVPWVYVSATSFTRNGASFGKGTACKYKQGGSWKYGSCFGVSGNTVSITGGSDYSLSNAPITDVHYSLANPADFPNAFAFTPVWTAAITNPVINNGTITGKFSINDKLLKFWFSILAGSGTTFGSGYWMLSLPVPASALTQLASSTVKCLDATAGGSAGGGMASIDYFADRLVFDLSTVRGNISSTLPFSWASGDRLVGFAEYHI